MRKEERREEDREGYQKHIYRRKRVLASEKKASVHGADEEVGTTASENVG